MRPPLQPTRTPAQRQSVVVVGGGFAGLTLIQHLRDARSTSSWLGNYALD
jgi:cation diffusion facilitator CzcD-associated flavoprotein CzcO